MNRQAHNMISEIRGVVEELLALTGEKGLVLRKLRADELEFRVDHKKVLEQMESVNNHIALAYELLADIDRSIKKELMKKR